MAIDRERAGPGPTSVLYDVSVLAYGISMPATHATGIFRAVRELLTQIAGCAGLDARLVCTESAFNETEIAGYLRGQGHPLRSRLCRAWRSRLPVPAAWQEGFHRAVRCESSTRAGRVRRRIHREFIDRTSVRAEAPAPVDVYHSFWSALPARDRPVARARILTVYDLIPILAPDAFPDVVVERFTQKLRSVDVHRDWVLCISESTKRDFCAYSSMDASRVFVMPLAACGDVFAPPRQSDGVMEVRRRYGIPTPRYVLSVSTVHRRKGSLQIAACFGRLVRSGELADASLVLVGPPLVDRAELVTAAGLDGPLERRIVTCGHVPDTDLAALYGGARVCVYLSVYEGFGLPPLEAMQCGTPVITSNTSSLPEVVGDAGIMVDPDDGEAIQAQVSRLWRDDGLHAETVARGIERARGFSWTHSMQRMLQVYDIVLDAR